MDLSPDKFQIVCPQADEDGFRCPGANEFGACKLYTNIAVRAKVRKGCAFRILRKPEKVKKKGTFVNPLKASKREAKASKES